MKTEYSDDNSFVSNLSDNAEGSSKSIEYYLNAILSNPEYAKMETDEVVRAVGALMTRKKIEARYGPKIKQLNNDGRWYIRVGKKTILRKNYDRVIDALVALDSAENPKRTLDNLAADWLMTRMLSRSSGTFRRDKQNYERFIKGTELASMDIDKITISDGYRWAEWLLNKKAMKEKYWKNIHGTLNSMMAFAHSNALDGLSIHRDKFVARKKRTDESRFFLPDEKKAVKELAYADAREHRSCMPLGIPFIFCTGVRDGELCALKWRDVETDYIHVQAEMVEDSDIDGAFKGFKYVPHCKSEAGDRRIPISQETRKILRLVKEYNFANGYPIHDDEFIFLRTWKGEIKPCTTRSFECRIKKYCRQAGMSEQKSQHDARRTFASDCFAKNMPLKNLQKIMGHSSLAQTEAYIYAMPCEDIHQYLDAINQ